MRLLNALLISTLFAFPVLAGVTGKPILLGSYLSSLVYDEETGLLRTDSQKMKTATLFGSVSFIRFSSIDDRILELTHRNSKNSKNS